MDDKLKELTKYLDDRIKLLLEKRLNRSYFDELDREILKDTSTRLQELYGVRDIINK